MAQKTSLLTHKQHQKHLKMFFMHKLNKDYFFLEYCLGHETYQLYRSFNNALKTICGYSERYLNSVDI